MIRLQAELEEYEYNSHFNRTNPKDEEEDDDESEYEDFAGENDWWGSFTRALKLWRKCVLRFALLIWYIGDQSQAIIIKFAEV